MDTINEVIKKQNYLSPSRYISGRIIEYDIKAANISIFRDRDIITEETYNRLLNLPKINREIEVGLMEKKDPDLYKKLQAGISEAKLDLAKFNKLNINQIIRIANDAVYINSDIDLQYTKFGNYIEFKQKSEYNIYCNLNGIIFLCDFMNNGDISLDIKGISDKNKIMELHKDYLLNIIISTIVLLERSSIDDAINYLSDMCEKYVKRELSIGYYREFESGLFRVNWSSPDVDNNGNIREYSFGYNYSLFDADKYHLDINYNYSILRELWSILIEIYSMRRK